MREGYKSRFYKDLSRLYRQGNSPSHDRTLLDRFLSEGDDAAFESLVARHGPMVLGICRRVLVSPHDVDDAFQATFLVLVRRAGQLRDADRLGPWLYGVALRVATKARAQAARRRERHHEEVVEACAHDGPSSGEWLDVRSILDAELGQLPAKFRDVLVLCLLEGTTAEEASRQLDCPLGTVKSRLARGREALRTRLINRGVAPAVALTAVSSVFASPVSAALIQTTLGTLANVSASVAPGVVALTRGVTPAMLSKTTVMTGLFLGGLALAGLGTATWIKLPAMPMAMAQQPGSAAEPGVRLPAQDGEAGPREQSKRNLKKILLAFHQYVDQDNHLPAAAIYGTDGQPKLSWRVALLPHLGEKELFEEFRLEEPWDSPHNHPLIARMPAVFETPHFPTPPGWTRIRGFIGKGALFEGAQGIGIAAITDGTSNTAMLASASEAIPWTKPGELFFSAGQPLPKLEDHEAKGWLIGMADGAAGDIPVRGGTFLQALITRNGGEPIQHPIMSQTPLTTPPAGSAPPLLPTAPAAMSGPPTGAVGLMPGMGMGMAPARGVSMGGMMPGMGKAQKRTGSEVGMMPGMMPGIDEAMMMPGVAGMMPGMYVPTPAAGTSSSTSRTVEQRLQQLEEKLERLIQRIDSQPGK